MKRQQENEALEVDSMEINADLCMPMTDHAMQLQARPSAEHDAIDLRPVVRAVALPAHIDELEPELGDRDAVVAGVGQETVELMLEAGDLEHLGRVEVPALSAEPPQMRDDWRRSRVQHSIGKRLEAVCVRNSIGLPFFLARLFFLLSFCCA